MNKKYNFTSATIYPSYLDHKTFFIEWQDDKDDFGRVVFNMIAGKLQIESENMTEEFVNELIAYLVNNAEIR